ncbi:hypothetical protein FPE01S_07_00610 [Flavihumibacter petaseus NBRC 106054]|uniref:Isoprenylcysteine carboxylmethyltransferase family protein n=2 Tax=Flavihumibacter TaxID=1004301 RepID=A0A0E9N795_9BACT|nr:hypothetical protein FPE01S_07_00610 [Flavihumibacter petaseus NBRC 106054]
MREPSLLKHFRDILILPFTMTVILPLLIHDPDKTIFPASPLFLVTGVIVAIAGLILFSCTVYLFRIKGKGTLAPWTPTQRLVISGPYRYCRNPMISGVFFILAGETLFFNSLNILIEAILFLVVNTLYFKWKEEPDLFKRFGEDYRKYKTAVPRWIPRMRPYRDS